MTAPMDEERDSVEQFTAQTPNWNLRYPNDYQQPADSPAAFKQLADDVDAALVTTQNNYLSNDQGLSVALQNDYNSKMVNMGKIIPATTWVADGQLSATSIVVPTLGPGAEITLGPFGINPGTYAICGTQHPSTWVYATYDDRGDGTAVIRVRNGTASTTHTNIRVHVFFLNLPS